MEADRVGPWTGKPRGQSVKEKRYSASEGNDE